jgi:hypothetical protein
MEENQRRPKYGGRKPGSLNKRTLFAREWAERLGMSDPCEFLTRVMNSDAIEVTKSDAEGNAVLDVDGKPVKQWVVVPMDTRVKCAFELMAYTYPRLSMQAVQAQVDTTVGVELDIGKLLADPDAARAAQELAIKLAQQEQAQVQGPGSKLLVDINPNYQR